MAAYAYWHRRGKHKDFISGGTQNRTNNPYSSSSSFSTALSTISFWTLPGTRS